MNNTVCMEQHCSKYDKDELDKIQIQAQILSLEPLNLLHFIKNLNGQLYINEG